MKDKRYSEPVEVGERTNLKQPAKIKAIGNIKKKKASCSWVIKLYIL